MLAELGYPMLSCLRTYPCSLLFVYLVDATGKPFNWEAFPSSEKCDEDYMGCAGPSRGEHPAECDSVDIQPPSDKHQQYQWGPHGAEQHWSYIGKTPPERHLPCPRYL